MRMPDIEAEARAAAGLVEREAAAVGHGITGLFQRHHAAPSAPQTPASQPATPITFTKGELLMAIAQLEADVKADLTDGLNWLSGFTDRLKAAAPGIIATSEAIAGSTVGQLAEIFLGKILPPDIEQEFLAIAKRYAGLGQPAAPTQPPTA